MSFGNEKDCESWTDEHVWYWMFENGFEQEHAEALWNNRVDGKVLAHMKKEQLYGMCKNLDKRKTSEMWHKIKSLKKKIPKQRKSFNLRSRPAPVEPDYSDDDDNFTDESFSSDEHDETAEDMDPNQASLAQEQEQYIAPDIQDNYEEFETFDDNADDDQLYLTPPGDDDDTPPPLPRKPMEHNSSLSDRAPVLPPRPVVKQLPSPGPQPLLSPGRKRLPSPGRSSVNSDENSGEEYVVPDPVQASADSEEMYLDPNESNDAEDCDEEYLAPSEVPQVTRVEPLLPKPPMARKDKSPQRVVSALNGRSKSSILPPKPVTSKPDPPSAQHQSQKPVSRIFSSIASQFETKSSGVPKPPIPSSNNRPTGRQGGAVWKIQNNLRASQGPHQPTPPKPALPTPAQPFPKLPARPSESRPTRQSEPSRPTRNSEPVLPSPSRYPSSKRDGNDLSNCLWFHETLDRKEAAAALNRYRREGAFVVRKSTNPSFPYSLSLYYNGKIRNLQIGIREDKKYALGKLKEGEGRFTSVQELIEYHRTHDVVLANNDGRTCLIEPVPLS